MITELAEELYNKSLQLKKYSPEALILKSKRLILIGELNEIKSLIGLLLEELKSSDSFSDEYYKLALSMYDSLFETVTLLASQTKNYRQYVWRLIHGFHNLPRAFLSIDNPAKISAEDARNYYQPYIR